MRFSVANAFRNTLLLAALFFSSLAAADTSNKWRLQFSGNSESSGTIVIQVTATGSAPISVEINVPFDKSENEVAEHAEKALDAVLPEDIYHVERDDGEDVLIKKKFGEENFEVLIVSNNVKGVSINLDKE